MINGGSVYSVFAAQAPYPSLLGATLADWSFSSEYNSKKRRDAQIVVSRVPFEWRSDWEVPVLNVENGKSDFSEDPSTFSTSPIYGGGRASMVKSHTSCVFDGILSQGVACFWASNRESKV